MPGEPDYEGRYADAAGVILALRADTDTSAWSDGTFGTVIQHCIQAAEEWIDAYVGSVQAAAWAEADATVPARVKLAATRLAAKYFIAMRTPLGLMTLQDGIAFEPLYDAQVMKWLSPWAPVPF